MKFSYIGLLFIGLIIQAKALSPKLDSTILLLKDCMNQEKVPLCDNHFNEMLAQLRRVDLDARGEFIYVLKDILKKDSSEGIIINLQEKLAILVSVYTEMDGLNTWSGRDSQILFQDVLLKYIKYIPLKKSELIKIFKEYTDQSFRYKSLGVLHSMLKEINSQQDIEEVMGFALFAKSYIKSQGDEYYIYQSAVSLIKKLTVKNLTYVRGFEGVYEIELFDDNAKNVLSLDHLVISSVDDKNGLLINFYSSKYRSSNFKFAGAALLEAIVFSVTDVFTKIVMILPTLNFNLT